MMFLLQMLESFLLIHELSHTGTLRMRDSLKTDSKAREIFEYAFQNDKFEKGMELLPTVTNVYVM